ANLHRSFKIAVLTFRKGGSTQSLPTAFMRLDVEELDGFPGAGTAHIPVALVRRISPASLSVLEMKSDSDVRLVDKMARFPSLGEQVAGAWNLAPTTEFHMTKSSHLFKTQ